MCQLPSFLPGLLRKGVGLLWGSFFSSVKGKNIDWIGQGDSCFSLAEESFILFLITFYAEPQYPQADKKEGALVVEDLGQSKGGGASPFSKESKN